MKYLLLLLLPFFAIAQKTTFKVEYSSSTKSITVTDTYITFSEYIDSYDNPMSSMPSGRKEIVKTAVLTKAQVQALKTKLDQSGFWKLAKGTYGATGEDRYYPYTINATNGKKIKTVVYRSNPSATEKAPKAFNDVESHINELVKSITNWK
jgi:hypothetical protein